MGTLAGIRRVRKAAFALGALTTLAWLAPSSPAGAQEICIEGNVVVACPVIETTAPTASPSTRPPTTTTTAPPPETVPATEAPTTRPPATRPPATTTSTEAATTAPPETAATETTAAPATTSESTSASSTTATTAKPAPTAGLGAPSTTTPSTVAVDDPVAIGFDQQFVPPRDDDGQRVALIAIVAGAGAMLALIARWIMVPNRRPGTRHRWRR